MHTMRPESACQSDQNRIMENVTGPNRPWIVRLLLNAQAWPLFGATGVVVLGLFWQGLYPHFYYMVDFFVLGLVWFGAVLMFVVLMALRSWLLHEYPGPVQTAQTALLQWACVFGILLLVTALLAFKVPMRLGFLTARPGLSRLVNEHTIDEFRGLAEDTRFGLYTISASSTERRGVDRSDAHQCVIFRLADDGEAAFIYSPTGIDDLSYNDGNKGHLIGHWYWMKED